MPSFIFASPRNEPARRPAEDTIALMAYAQKAIKANSAIKNVVLDLSLNGGGTITTCMVVASFLLGSATLVTKDASIGAALSASYIGDTNLDGTFDQEDSLSGKNLYCLTTTVSFSCGNYLAALLKSSGKATIVGQKSGGGTCAVFDSICADGTTYQMSGYRQMAVWRNGAYESVEEGTQPDVYLAKAADFYDRTNLATSLDALK